MICCLNCKIEFKPKRSTAKFCSDKCKKQLLRGTNLEDISGTKVSGTEKEELSGTELKRTKITGLCHGCKVQQENKDVCICHLCIGNKITHESLGLEMCEV